MLNTFLSKLNYVIGSASLRVGIIFILIYLITYSVPKPFQYQLIYVLLFSLILITFFNQKSNRIKKVINILVYLFYSFTTLLVATTGWFSSPFNYLLYFTAILLSFFFSAMSTLTYITLLFLVLLKSINSIRDTNSAFLTILSILSMIPVSIFLRQKYLQLIEHEKEILILKRKTHFESTADKEFDNSITRFAGKLRDILTVIKQYSLKQSTEDSKRVLSKTNEAFHLLNRFEEETTGKKIGVMQDNGQHSR